MLTARQISKAFGYHGPGSDELRVVVRTKLMMDGVMMGYLILVVVAAAELGLQIYRGAGTQATHRSAPSPRAQALTAQAA